MPTYYSQYIQENFNVFFSSPTEIDINHYVSNYSGITFKSSYSNWAEISLQLSIPGGVFSWTNVSSEFSSINACRLHQTVEATIPLGNPTHQINENAEFTFQTISGQNIFSRNFSSPSIYFNNIGEPRIEAITNKIISFIFGDNKFNEENCQLKTQYIPQKIVVGKREDGNINGYCYCNDNNVYAFEFEDEMDFSSSSSSSSSSITESLSSLSSDCSTHLDWSSQSSLSSISSRSSGSSSSNSSASSKSSSFSSSSSINSSSVSSVGISSASSFSSRSSGSSSSINSQIY